MQHKRSIETENNNVYDGFLEVTFALIMAIKRHH